MSLYRKLVLGVGVVCAAILFVGWGLSEPGHKEREKASYACTMIGCSSIWGVERSQVTKVFPEAAAVTVCASDECVTYGKEFESWRADGKKRYGVVPLKGGRIGGTATAALIVRDRQGSVLARSRIEAGLEPYWPNGEHCPPPCFTVRAEIDPATGGLRRTRSTEFR